MCESGNNIFDKLEINFSVNSKLVTTNGAISSDDEDGILTLSKFGSFDDQHELTCKQSKPPAHRQRRTELMQNTFYSYPYRDTFLSAAYSNDTATIKKLLASGIDPNYCDSKGRTALHLTACKGNFETAALLLLNGADANKKDLNGNSPLHLAVLSSHIQMVTLLLKNNANIKEVDNAGRTPLYLAKSKLRLLQDCTSFNSEQLKAEVKHIIEMMQIYLAKVGVTEKILVLNQFITRFNLHNTKEDVNNDLCDLLKSISNLNLS